MVYADDDESLLEAEEDGSLPDRDQDIKPRFHSSRFHDSEDGEDDDEDIVNVWNLRKCSAAALDILSNVFGDDILPALMPVVQAKLSATNDEAWKEREAAVLVPCSFCSICLLIAWNGYWGRKLCAETSILNDIFLHKNDVCNLKWLLFPNLGLDDIMFSI